MNGSALCHKCAAGPSIPGCPWCKGRVEAYASGYADGCAHRDRQFGDWLRKRRAGLARTAIARRAEIDRALVALGRREHVE